MIETSDALSKKESLYMVVSRYMRTLLQMQNPKYVAQKEAKKKILQLSP